MNSKKQAISYCQEHPDEIITNFCKNVACLQPLCPECVFIHNDQHQSRNTYAEIQSIKNVYRSCSAKIQDTLKQIQKEIGNCQVTNSFNSEICEQTLEDLNEYKNKIFDIVCIYFKKIADQIQKSMKDMENRTEQYKPLLQKLNQQSEELQHYLIQLDQGNINILKAVCRKDYSEVLNKIRQEIFRTSNQNDYSYLKPQIDLGREFNLKQELSQIIYLVSATNVGYSDPTQNVQNVQLTPQHQPPIYQQNLESANQKPPYYQSFSRDVQQQHTLQKSYGSNHTNDFFTINQPDYFDTQAMRKFLHFFQNDDNKLHLIDLEHVSSTGKILQKTVNLKINFKVPSFHKSIATPNANLYLTGGTIPDGTMAKSGFIYEYDFQLEKLNPISVMNFPRSSHGICYLNGYIYLVGGYEHKHVMTKKCERFSLKTKKFELIANLNFPATSLSLCTYNNRYIFKFGGIGEGYEGHLLSPYVEKYDTQIDKWSVIDPKISKFSHNKLGNSFGLLSTSASVQINYTDIFVFGGYLEDNSGSNQTFLFSTIDKNIEPIENVYYIKEINNKLLTHSEAFWNNIPIVHENKIYALQNIAGENSDNCLENERRVIVFDGNQWFNLSSNY